ncbi:MAG TPA: hypothetical protein ENO24_05720 [Chloroflexi bacterium]|nr:hypothetical protein [Chloroflexota bacterium]
MEIEWHMDGPLCTIWNGTSYENSGRLNQLTVNEFHHFKAEILDDLRVSFYIDDMYTPLWTSTTSVDNSHGIGPIILHGNEPSWLDNVVIASPCLFQEDFSDDLSRWTLWGSPEPYVDTDLCNPARSLQINGDGMYASGVTSVQAFSLAPDMTVGYDGRLAEHAWHNSFEVFMCRDWPASDQELGDYAFGWGCGGTGTCGETWCCDGAVWNGATLEVNNSLPNIAAGSFHHFKAEVQPDLRISFYIDDMVTPARTSSSSVDTSYGTGPFVIAGRFGWIDNVLIQP